MDAASRLAKTCQHTFSLALAIGIFLLSTFRPAHAAQDLPSYYPEDYKKLIQASKNESGLLIYSVLAQSNWQGCSTLNT